MKGLSTSSAAIWCGIVSGTTYPTCIVNSADNAHPAKLNSAKHATKLTTTRLLITLHLLYSKFTLGTKIYLVYNTLMHRDVPY